MGTATEPTSQVQLQQRTGQFQSKDAADPGAREEGARNLEPCRDASRPAKKTNEEKSMPQGRPGGAPEDRVGGEAAFS